MKLLNSSLEKKILSNRYFIPLISCRNWNGGGFFEDDNRDVIKLVNNALVHMFEDFYIDTTGGTEIESKRIVPQVSTIMRLLTSKDKDLSSYFAEIKGKNFIDTLWKQILIDIDKTQANKQKILGILQFQQFFEFCKTFKKVPKVLGFHLTFKTTVLQKTVYTRLPAARVNIVHFNHLHLFVPMLIPSPETQSNFNRSIRESFTSSFDSWTTDWKAIDTQLEY